MDEKATQTVACATRITEEGIRDAYRRGHQWAVTSGDENVELLHKLYGVVTDELTAGSRGRMFCERDFPPEVVRALAALAYELVNDSKVFSFETYEAAVSFLNGVRDGVWLRMAEGARMARRGRASVSSSSSSSRRGASLTRPVGYVLIGPSARQPASSNSKTELLQIGPGAGAAQ